MTITTRQTKTRFDPTLTDSEGRTVFHIIRKSELNEKGCATAMCGCIIRRDQALLANGRTLRGAKWTICPLCASSRPNPSILSWAETASSTRSGNRADPRPRPVPQTHPTHRPDPQRPERTITRQRKPAPARNSPDWPPGGIGGVAP